MPQRGPHEPPKPKPIPITGDINDRIQDLASRVSKLEASRRTTQSAVGANQDAVLQLQDLLKLTIEGVIRLAKGKSLGALGLPGPEEWDPPV